MFLLKSILLKKRCCSQEFYRAMKSQYCAKRKNRQKAGSYNMANSLDYLNIGGFFNSIGKIFKSFQSQQAILNSLNRDINRYFWEHPWRKARYTRSQSLCYNFITSKMDNMDHFTLIIKGYQIGRPIGHIVIVDWALKQDFFISLNQVNCNMYNLEFFECSLGNKMAAYLNKLDLYRIKEIILISDPITNQGFKDLLKCPFMFLKTLYILNTNITMDGLNLIKRLPIGYAGTPLKFMLSGSNLQAHNHTLKQFLKASDPKEKYYFNLEQSNKSENLLLHFGLLAKLPPKPQNIIITIHNTGEHPEATQLGSGDLNNAYRAHTFTIRNHNFN